MATSCAARRFAAYARTNVPASQASSVSAAVTRFAKSAIRGILASRVTGSARSAPLTVLRSAASMRGRARSNANHSSASGFRSWSAMRGSSIKIDRSSRSERVASSPMPVRMTGRWAVSSTSSASVCNRRVVKLPPVDIRHNASEKLPSIRERLSNASTHPLRAAIARSRSFRGSERSGAALGRSVRNRRRRRPGSRRSRRSCRFPQTKV